MRRRNITKPTPRISDEDYRRLVHRRMRIRNNVEKHRARRADDIRCLQITITNATRTVEAFIKAGLLTEAQKDDDLALEMVIAQLCRAGFALQADAAAPSPAPSAPGLAPDAASASNSSAVSTH